jgi:hypothetical protein
MSTQRNNPNDAEDEDHDDYLFDRPPLLLLRDAFTWSVLIYLNNASTRRNRARRDRNDRRLSICSNPTNTYYDETNPRYYAHYITNDEYGSVERAHHGSLILTKETTADDGTITYVRSVFISYDTYVSQNHGRHGHAYAPRFVIHPTLFLTLFNVEQDNFYEGTVSFALFAQYPVTLTTGSPFDWNHRLDNGIDLDDIHNVSFFFPAGASIDTPNVRYDRWLWPRTLNSADLALAQFTSRQQRPAWDIARPIADWIQPRNESESDYEF